MPKCKACGAPIDFIKTVSGSKMPVNPRPLQFEPDDTSKEKLITSNGKMVHCRIVKGGPWDPRKVGFRPHFATCPQAEELRRRKNPATKKEEQPVLCQQLRLF